ncbi:MAG: glycosyltransferase [Mycobacteriales bacterium]
MSTTDPTPDRLPARHSVVIPTYQRRDLVTAAVQALAKQTCPPAEVIVVVDGSDDGTAEALRALSTPYPLRVVEQPNAGAARARNHGAALSVGEFLLFLDDDMVADPGLLTELVRVHTSGADAVLGHIPVAPDTPRNFLSQGLQEWASRRCRRLVASNGALEPEDLLTGQLSVRHAVFAALGGFDERFTRDGRFGGEDTDFGRRLFDAGHRVVFAPNAISHQHYAVGPRAYLRQWHDAGSADVAYVRKHPDDLEKVRTAKRPDIRSNRYLIRPLARVAGVRALVAAGARPVAVRLAERRPEDPRVARVFFKVRNLEYWRGVNEAGGLPLVRPFRVLCYHSVSDLSRAARIAQYGIPAPLLARQLRLLRRAGVRFVTPAEVHRALDGRAGLPRRAVLVTFDDCFADLVSDGLPVLRAEDVPAAAFAVAGRVGGTNEWDTAIGAQELALLDALGLRRLRDAGVEIGAHAGTHRPLTGVPAAELPDEISGAATALAGLGLGPVRLFAYPHGDHDDRVRRAVRDAGLQAGFTVTPGLVRPGVDRFDLPRIEVLRRDGAGLRLLVKVFAAGRLPHIDPRVRRTAHRATSALRREVNAGRQSAHTR